jgi:inorganic pyrophosphatase
VIVLFLLIKAFKKVDPVAGIEMYEAIAGYGLGGSTVALFGRVGGGIYTKAADVGADLAGKVCEGLEEDSPKNPGTIADNVGDNVGDIAGMGADLFGSLAESTCAALVVSGSSIDLLKTPDAIFYPLIVTATGILASFIAQFLANIGEVNKDNVENKLKMQLVWSSLIMTGLLVPSVYILPPHIRIPFGITTYNVSRWAVFGCVVIGLWAGLLIGFVTEYYTSNKYSPVRKLVDSCKMGAAPNIISVLLSVTNPPSFQSLPSPSLSTTPSTWLVCTVLPLLPSVCLVASQLLSPLMATDLLLITLVVLVR